MGELDFCIFVATLKVFPTCFDAVFYSSYYAPTIELDNLKLLII